MTVVDQLDYTKSRGEQKKNANETHRYRHLPLVFKSGWRMLTIKGIANAPGYRNYLAIEAVGEWVGKGAEMLGLQGEVFAKEYKALRLGMHPETGEKLRRNTPVDRVYNLTTLDGRKYQKTYHAAQVYDCVIGAPKSVSILGIEDHRAIDSHRQAVTKAREKMEELCGPIVIAQYHHNYSRAEDPHLHTHLVAMNLSWTGERWQTIHASRLIRAQREITESYRDVLLGQLNDYGYKINRPNIDGIPQELVQRFSKRSDERDELIKAFAADRGFADIYRKEVSNLVRDNRPTKPQISYERFWDQQRDKLTQSERLSLRQTVEKAYERSHELRLHIEVAEGEESGPSLRPATYGQRISM